MVAALRLKEMGYQGRIAATTKFRDEEDDLKAVGVAHTFNIYTEAGLGFANEIQNYVRK
jgi:glutathione-regulated potassium-efflux system ancillary protein KefC